MTSTLPNAVRHLLQAATPVLCIHGVEGPLWRRNVTRGARVGPWLTARYDVLDSATWMRASACLYLVTGHDGGLRYVGISRNGLKHRWRTSPALHAETGELLPKRQLFHSQCWKHVEAEFGQNPQSRFEVSCLSGDELIAALGSIDDEVRALATLADDAETVVMAIERWICNRSSDSLARWNVAMTGRR